MFRHYHVARVVGNLVLILEDVRIRGVMEELGRTILGLVGVVKVGGIVIFLPSYGYLDKLFKAWEHTILPKLQTRRKVLSAPGYNSYG